ncbi:MAG: sugar nucleotide-binding protein, partial [Cyclobacteriaceae bacterium]|nr:sugar nucleotide-binding protein [Cyclobacteriaceae bacterium]
KNSLEQGKTIQVVDDQYRTPTLAEDLAMGCYLAAKKKATGIYHISGSDFLTPYAMAIQTADHFGLPTELITKTDSTRFTQPARRPLRTGFIITKAMNELGYRPHTFAEGIALVQQQLEQNHQ